MANPRKISKPAAAPQPKPVSAPAAPMAAPAAPVVVQRSEVKGAGSMPKMPATRTPTHDEIKKRAFEIYAGRGYAPGDQNADWLEAERQLKAGL